jgi:hypothetical protein
VGSVYHTPPQLKGDSQRRAPGPLEAVGGCATGSPCPRRPSIGAEVSASTYAKSRAEKPSLEGDAAQGEIGIYMLNRGPCLARTYYILCLRRSLHLIVLHGVHGGRAICRTEAGRMAGCWVDVGEAARELDISTDDVGKRVARHCARRPPALL